jgi:phage FluMu protein gp41
MMKRMIIKVAALGCIFGLTTSVYAQDATTTTVKEQIQPRESAIEMVPDDEKDARTKRAVDSMRGALSKVLRYLEEAREQRDVLKLNCVNEKLTAIKGLLRVSEQAYTVMLTALATKDFTVAQHEYEKIMIANSKTDELSAESEVCIGELAVYSGQTSVTVEVKDEVISSSALSGSGSGAASTGSESSSSTDDESSGSALQESIMDSPEAAPSAGTSDSASAGSDDAGSGDDTGGGDEGVQSNPNGNRPPAASAS